MAWRRLISVDFKDNFHNLESIQKAQKHPSTIPHTMLEMDRSAYDILSIAIKSNKPAEFLHQEERPWVHDDLSQPKFPQCLLKTPAGGA